MAVLTIRNLPDDVHRRLRLRAARAERSMEAEARAILAQACAAEPLVSADALKAWVSDLYGGALPAGVVDELIADRRSEAATE